MRAASIFDMFLQYIDNNYLLGVLFVISIFYYIGKAFYKDTSNPSRTENKQGFAALLVVIFLFLTVFNPFLYPYLSTIADSGASYYRFIWIIPMVAISSCFLTELIFAVYQRLSAKRLALASAVITALVLCSAIMLSGTSYLTEKNLTFPENKFTISRASLDISQFIQDDPDHDGEAVVLAPTEIMMELLAYDISINPALPRSEYLEYGSGDSYTEALLSMVLEGAQRGTGYTAYYLHKLDVDYIVALTNFHLDEYLTNIDYPVYNRTGDYTVYKRSDAFDPFKWMD